MIKLYGMTGSGNCWKPAVLMTMLGIAFEHVEIDMLGGETRRAPFLALNPNGRVPLLQLGDGRLLAESNAMLCYLAEGSALLPPPGFDRAKVLEWMFFEQYSHEPYIASVRFWIHYRHKREEWRDKIAEASSKGHAALAVMETALAKQAYLAGSTFSIADIALYAYTHVADQGDFDLSPYPAVLAWLQRCEQQPGFFSMR
ncbi:MAG: glutathione S-transferase [Hydrocarboniphaga sp.]|uniref:glutathione S-transferase family protein n=1 Tax=Hydrocarboniphaga sp. TaxID=2033016 RepID=UPI002611308A|nr:glutathione S-transferase family protein [Hydrocarboniphaga sp.]MDB5969258.1 glutathione S-transferase [Hydrocarboniphaga sp.]